MISLNRHVLARTLASAAVSIVFLVASASASYAVTTSRVDGQGGGGGRILAHISGDTAGVGRSGVPWVFYGANPGAGWRLRVAKLAAGTTVYETLDGTGGTNGRTGDSVGSDVSAVQLNGVPNVFYYDDTTGALRRAWYQSGSWSFQTVDGTSTSGGRTTRDVGLHSSAIVVNGQINVFYADATAGDIRRAVWNGTTWQFSVIDGNSTVGGRTTSTVGSGIATGVWGSSLRVLYSKPSSGLRMATLSGTSWTYRAMSSLGNADVSVLVTSPTEVHVAYIEGDPGSASYPIYSALWNGTTWSVDERVSYSESQIPSSVVLFDDAGTPALATGLLVCYGSGGCDNIDGVGKWNGTSFNDPYFGDWYWFANGHNPGRPSSVVTVGGVPQLFIGDWGGNHLLFRAVGPF